MKNTSKLIGIVLALIVVILAVFLVTINSDGTIIKNSTGYTAQLKPQRVSDNIFYAGVFSDTSSAALRAISGGSNGSDYLVIGQDQTAEGVPYYRN